MEPIAYAPAQLRVGLLYEGIPMSSSYKTISRINERIVKLKNEFAGCLDYFEKANLFTGPSLYFHFKTCAIRKMYPSAVATLSDKNFFESLYATLTAWGMHRMGPGNTKLVDLEDMRISFIRQSNKIAEIESFILSELERNVIVDITSRLWEIILQLKVGIGGTKIVANSKALHHLLPNLIPPIDREYTLRFFYNHTTLNQGDEKAFKEIYPFLYIIASSKKELIRERLGHGMNTSETKVIDNAIVGFGRKYIKIKENKSEE